MPNVAEQKKKTVTRTVGMTHYDILFLPLQIFARGEDDGIPEEMPREYDLRGCGFALTRNTISGSLRTGEYLVHFEESVRLDM
jgi:hypothetical protein